MVKERVPGLLEWALPRMVDLDRLRGSYWVMGEAYRKAILGVRSCR